MCVCMYMCIYMRPEKLHRHHHPPLLFPACPPRPAHHEMEFPTEREGQGEELNRGREWLLSVCSFFPPLDLR